MTCQCLGSHRISFGPLALAALAIAIPVSIVLAVSLDPFADIELKRQALAGSDALLERGVIPPNQLDWIMVDCSASREGGPLFRSLHQAACEASEMDQAAY